MAEVHITVSYNMGLHEDIVYTFVVLLYICPIEVNGISYKDVNSLIKRFLLIEGASVSQ